MTSPTPLETPENPTAFAKRVLDAMVRPDLDPDKDDYSALSRAVRERDRARDAALVEELARRVDAAAERCIPKELKTATEFMVGEGTAAQYRGYAAWLRSQPEAKP